MKEQICKHCKDPRPLNQFGKYKGYVRKYCNTCRSLNNQKSKECKHNREISQLINWRAA